MRLNQIPLFKNGLTYFYLFLLSLSIYAIRSSGPSDLEGYAQNRNIGYVIDLVWEQQWLLQYDVQGRICSKPPLHTWLTGVPATIFGINRFSLTLISFLSIFALSALIYAWGKNTFGKSAAFAAAVIFLLAPATWKQIALVRTDALFSLLIFLAAWSAWSSWQEAKPAYAFWIFSALATLTKGPLGLVLAAFGLMAIFWERHSGFRDGPYPRMIWKRGLLIWLGLCLCWFIPALLLYKQELYDKMIVNELIRHSTGGDGDLLRHLWNFPKPFIYFIGRFFPFSLLFILSFWRLLWHPASTASERRLERFLACWITAGLLLFSLASHQRADLLYPLWPAAALLAGRELFFWQQRFQFRQRSKVGLLFLVIVIMGPILYLTYHQPPKQRAKVTNYSESIQGAAQSLLASNLPLSELQHINTPVTLQLALKTKQKWQSPEAIAAKLQAEKSLLIILNLQREANFFATLGLGVQAQEVWRWPSTTADSSPWLAAYQLHLSKKPEASDGLK